MMHMHGRFNNPRGFTLVEILVVVVILGIASALVIPQISSRGDLRAAAGARMIMADLIYAQNRAIATQKPHYIKFEPDKKQYALYDDPAMSTPLVHPVQKEPYITRFETTGTLAVPDVKLKSVDFDDGHVLVFDVLGSPRVPNGSGTTDELLSEGKIVLKSGDFEMQVLVQPFTGEVQTP